ncbi:MAG: hypothetical protein ACC609_02275 [Methanobacterium formicicum]
MGYSLKDRVDISVLIACMTTQLKDDPAKLDEVLLENIQDAAFGPVIAITPL